MFRFRYLFPLLAVLTTIITSSVLAAPKKLSFSVNQGDEIPKEVISYATDQNIDIDTAIHRLAIQNLAGNLDAELSKNEEDIYAGLWIQHSPHFRIIVQFTQEGKETIRIRLQIMMRIPLTILLQAWDPTRIPIHTHKGKYYGYLRKTLLTMEGEETHDKQIYVFRGHGFIAYIDSLYISRGFYFAAQ